MKILAVASFIFAVVFAFVVQGADETIISDRPGDTDNPKTMERGQFRTETGIYSYTHNVSGGLHTTTQNYGNVYLIGSPTDDSEIQVSYDGFSQSQTGNGAGTGTVVRTSGGETLRYKQNLIGNREGRFALALLPRVQKTEGLDGNQWQGALGVPFAYDITEAWNISFTPEWRVETNTETNRRAHGAFNAIVVEYDFSDAWGLFGQNSEHTQHIRDGWAVTVGGGAAYKASKKLQLDLGIDFGVTGPADAFNLKAGFTYVL